MPRLSRELAFAAALAAATFALYLPALGGRFLNYDDNVYVTQNSHVVGGLTNANFAWAWSTFHAANWHPLTWLSLQLDVTLFGMQPWSFHLTNNLIHAANAALLFLALRALSGKFFVSGFVAAVFAVHPLHVESVAWISERKDVLSTFFALAALWAYVGYARRPSPIRGAAICLLFALSLLAKPMYVTLPFLLLLLDWWPLGRFPSSTGAALDKTPTRPMLVLFVEKLPLIVLSLASCIVTFRAQSAGGAVQLLENRPLIDRFFNAARAYLAYVYEACYPVELAAFHPLPSTAGVSAGRMPADTSAAIAGVFLVFAFTAFAVWRAPRRPYLLVGWFWYLGTLIPVIGIVQVGEQAHADRYTYFPLTGLCIAFIWWVGEVSSVRSRNLFAALGLVVLSWFSFLTVLQIGYWKDPVTLWSRNLEVVGPEVATVCNLGTAWCARGEYDKAQSLFDKALAVDPTNFIANINMGVISRRRSQFEAASRYFEAALRTKPSDANCCYYAGEVMLLRDQPAAAERYFTLGGDLEPDDPRCRVLRGMALLRMNRPQEAAEAFTAASKIAPDWPSQLFSLGWRLATNDDPDVREGPLAVLYGAVLYETSGGRDPRCLDLLAAAFAEVGRFPDAVSLASQALCLAQEKGDQITVRQIEERLRLYSKERPYRSTGT